MITDPIADFLTRIRNAQMAGHKVVDIPSSNLKKKITEILFDQGYIANYRFDDNSNYQGVIKIALKYDKALIGINNRNFDKYIITPFCNNDCLVIHFIQFITQNFK